MQARKNIDKESLKILNIKYTLRLEVGLCESTSNKLGANFCDCVYGRRCRINCLVVATHSGLKVVGNVYHFCQYRIKIHSTCIVEVEEHNQSKILSQNVHI